MSKRIRPGSRKSQRGNINLGGIMNNIFGTKPAAAPSPPANPAPTGNPTPGAPLPGSDPNNPTVPANSPAAPGNPATPPKLDPANPQSYLDANKGIWETPKNPANPELGTPFFAGLDPAKAREAAKKVNFAGAISQEQVQAIAAGGEGAVKAFQESMNAVAQAVYGQNAITTAQIVDQALAKQAEQIKAALPGIVRNMSIGDSLAEQHPLLSHPSVQPVAAAVRSQLIAKNPSATKAEIENQVVDFLRAVGAAVPTAAPTTSTPNAPGTAKATDWEKYFSS